MGRPRAADTRKKRFAANVAVCDTRGTYHRLCHDFLRRLISDDRIALYLGSRVPARDRPASFGGFVLLCVRERKLAAITEHSMFGLTGQTGGSRDKLVDMMEWPSGPPVYGVTYTIELDAPPEPSQL